jgi:hypothetical protein
VDPVILASARKHRVHEDDMLHAYRNPIRVFDVDDLTMIGVALAEGIDFIVHAMPARPSFLE